MLYPVELQPQMKTLNSILFSRASDKGVFELFIKFILLRRFRRILTRFLRILTPESDELPVFYSSSGANL